MINLAGAPRCKKATFWELYVCDTDPAQNSFPDIYTCICIYACTYSCIEFGNL